MKTKAKVIARSTNRNAFGLSSHVIILDCGLAFRALRSASAPDADRYASQSEHLLTLGVGDKLDVRSILVLRGFECIEELSPAPSADIIAELFSV